MILEQLRHCAESQNAIMVLKDQCRSDMENLEESITEKTRELKQFNINMELPQEDINENDGSALQDYFEGKHDEVLQLHKARKEELDSANKSLAATQRVVSEKNAVLGNKQQRQAVIEAKLNRLNGADGSVSRAKVIIQELHKHEIDEMKQNPPPMDSSPQDVINYLDGRLKAIEEESPANMDGKAVKRVLKKINKMFFVGGTNDQGVPLICCPCCDRFITNPEDFSKFDEKMKWLMTESSLVHVDDVELQQYEALESKYKEWRFKISEFSEDIRDFQRMTEETRVLEQEIQEARDDLRTHQTTQAQQAEQVKKLQSEVDDLRNLHDTTKRWAYDSSRIKEKCTQIGVKNVDLSISEAGAGRDLRTVGKCKCAIVRMFFLTYSTYILVYSILTTCQIFHLHSQSARWQSAWN